MQTEKVRQSAYPNLRPTDMEQPVPVKEVKILETAEDIQQRREQVLKRYVDFKEAARVKRDKLEDSRRYQVIQSKRYDATNHCYSDLKYFSIQYPFFQNSCLAVDRFLNRKHITIALKKASLSRSSLKIVDRLSILCVIYTQTFGRLFISLIPNYYTFL